jgi:hypothetical protein
MDCWSRQPEEGKVKSSHWLKTRNYPSSSRNVLLAMLCCFQFFAWGSAPLVLVTVGEYTCPLVGCFFAFSLVAESPFLVCSVHRRFSP